MKGWLLLLTPVAMGFALWFVWRQENVPFRLMDLWLPGKATLALLSGIALSAFFDLLYLLSDWMKWTAKTNAEGAYAQAHQHHHQFLNRLDHELKNPLTALLSIQGNLKQSIPQSDVLTKSMLEQLDSQLWLRNLLNDLRKLHELESGTLNFVPVELQQLLSDAFDHTRTVPEASRRQLILTLPNAWPGLPQIMGDEDLLYLAFANLLHNAVKFSRPGDRVELSAFADKSHVTVRVADTGLGIAPEEQALVWNEFYRSPATRQIAGSGLGLSFVRIIIQRHQGQVELSSEFGAGTAVTLRLPVRPPIRPPIRGV